MILYGNFYGYNTHCLLSSLYLTAPPKIIILHNIPKHNKVENDRVKSDQVTVKDCF